MADTETGIRWWLRYIVVPLLGGGGVIALIVASIIQRNNPRSNRVSQNPSAQTEVTTSLGSATKTLSNQTPSAAPARNAPHSSAAPPTTQVDNAGSAVNFGVYDQSSGILLPPGEIGMVPSQASFYVAWKVAPGVVKGSLILRDQWSPADFEDVAVGNEGSRPYSCNTPRTLNLSLIDKGAGGGSEDANAADHILGRATVMCE